MDGEDEELAKALEDIKLKTIYYAIYNDLVFQKDVDENLPAMPNLKFNIGDVISDVDNGRKFVVLDILYSKGAKDYLYHLDDTELCVDFNIRWKSAEKFYELYKQK